MSSETGRRGGEENRVGVRRAGKKRMGKVGRGKGEKAGEKERWREGTRDEEILGSRRGEGNTPPLTIVAIVYGALL